MKIEDLDDVESDGKESVYRRQVVKVDAKMALVGAGGSDPLLLDSSA